MGNPPVKLSPRPRIANILGSSLLFRKKLAIDIIMKVLLKLIIRY
jgi:hypothetical protein